MEMQPQPEQGVPPQGAPEQMPPEQAQPEQAQQEGGDPKEIHQRFIVNVMKLASGDQYDKMMAMAKSADNGMQSLGRALYFILSSVQKGLKGKGVEIPPQMWLAENGIIEQSTRLIAVLLISGGVKIEEEDIDGAMELAAQQLVGDADNANKQEGAQAVEQAQGQPQPEQQPQQPQQPPQQGGGLLTGVPQ